MYREGSKNGERCSRCGNGVYKQFKKEEIKYSNGQKQIVEHYECSNPKCRDRIEFIAHVEY